MSVNMYEYMKKYAVPAESVEDFCNKYYQPRAFHDRTGDTWDYDGETYQAACIASHKEYIKEKGYCMITHHDSKTGETVTYYPEISNLKLRERTATFMKRVAVIQDSYVRDTQVFVGNPRAIENDMSWWNDFVDVRHPCHYAGIFDGENENEILNKAAEYMGVHSDVITLIDVSDATFNSGGMANGK